MHIPNVTEDWGDVANAMSAFFGDPESYVRYAMDIKRRIRLLGIYSDGDISGREMVAWLKEAYGQPILVNEVAIGVEGFWDKMRAEGLIKGWSYSPFAGPTVVMPAYVPPHPSLESGCNQSPAPY